MRLALGVAVVLALSFAACDSTETVKTVTVERPSASASAPVARSQSTQTMRDDPQYRACDPNIEARVDTTTCAFAQNVFWTYWTSGEISPISVYSPAARRSLRVRCTDDGTRVACTSRDGSGIRFPLAALDAYSQSQADVYAANHDLGPDAYESPSANESDDYSGYLDGTSADGDYGDYSGSDSYPEDDGALPGENIPNYDNGRGYRVQCNDGTYSQSGGIQGACSHHGGVAP